MDTIAYLFVIRGMEDGLIGAQLVFKVAVRVVSKDKV